MMRRFILFGIISALAAASADAALTPSIQNQLPALRYSSVAWAPLDTVGTESGKSIVALSGMNPAGEIKTYIVWIETSEFTGQPSITRIDDTSIPGVIFGDLDWADFDRDGYLDLAIAGRRSGVTDETAENTVMVYRQVWDGATYQGFVPATYFPNPADHAVDSCYVKWVDFNVDGYVDLFVMGRRRFATVQDGVTRVRAETRATMFRNILDGTTHRFIADPGVASGLNQITPTYRGGMAWGDMDGDGAPDLAITGINLTEYQGGRVIRDTLTVVYVNNPPGVLTLDSFQEDNPLPGNYDGGIAWGDFNRNGFLDLAITGKATGANAGQRMIRVLENLGLRNRVLMSQKSIALDNALSVAGDIVWMDFDGDGWLDIICMGDSATAAHRSGLRYFRNNGDGTFTRAVSEDGSFPAMIDGGFAVGHLDGNGTLDIITTGYNTDDGRSETIAWLSDHPAPAAPLEPPSFNRSQLTFTDTQIVLAWNRDPDLARDASITYEALMYYTNPADPAIRSYKVFSHRMAYQRGVHGTGPIFRINRSLAPNPSMQLFIRTVDAAGRTSRWSDKILVQVEEFVLSEENLEPMHTGLVSWADIDNSGWPDLFINGLNQGLAPSNRLYRNFAGDLRVEERFNLGGLYGGGVFWGDVDGSGYLDAFMTGSLSAGARVTAIFRNMSAERPGTFWPERYTSQQLPPMTGSRMAVGDLNNNGRMDAIVTGLAIDGPATYLLINHGVHHTGTDSAEVDFEVIPFDLQLEDISPEVQAADGLFDGWVSLHDINQNGYLDITIQGNVDYGGDDPQGGDWNNYMAGYTVIYRNEGNLEFTKWHEWEGGAPYVAEIPVGSTLLDQLGLGQHQWVDVNNNGHPDLVIVGFSSVSEEFNKHGYDLEYGFRWDDSALRIYRNTGDGNLVMHQSLPGLYHAALNVVDVDNDNYPDIVLTGFNDHVGPAGLLPEGTPATWYFRNRGDGTFERRSIEVFENVGADQNEGLAGGSLAMADYDLDGDIDLAVTGRAALGEDNFGPRSRLFSNTAANTGISVNRPPAPPAGLTSLVDTTRTVEISWLGSTATLPGGDPVPYTYTFRVGTRPGAGDIRPGVEPYGPGRLGYVTSARLYGLEDAVYYWTVQASNPGWRRSPWASEQQFIIDTTPPVVAGVLGDSIGVGLDGNVRINVDFFDALTGVDTTNTGMQVAISLAGDRGAPRAVRHVGWNPGDVWAGSVDIPLSTFLREPVTFHISGVRDNRGNVMPDTTFEKYLEFSGTMITARLGGSIRSATGAIALYVPPNAVTADVGVSLIERSMTGLPVGPANATPQGIVAQLAPDVVFQQPAVLTMYYGTDNGSARPAQTASDLHIFRLNDAEDGWDYIGGLADTDDESVSAPVMQLGTYALFDAPGFTDVSTLEDLVCIPRVFSPGVDVAAHPDALGSKTAITFSVAQADGGKLATVKVFNRAGRLVRKLSSEVAPGANAIDWDGRDEDRDIVPSGLYIVMVEVADAKETQTVAVVNRFPRP